MNGTNWLFPLAMLVCVAPLAADQVFNETVIVNGSISLGFDAVNNEVFGDDRIRLKENNLRIAFNDTSTLPGDSGNDWEITANESSSGGRSYLGIRDITTGRNVFQVSAGAPQDAIRLVDGGHLGILTGAPQAAVHVKVSDDALSITEGVVIGPEAITPAGVLMEVHGPLYISGATHPVLTVDTTGGAKLFVEGSAIFSKNVEIASSRTFKEDVRSLTSGEIGDAFAKLAPVEYRYLGDGEKQLGFIAEDVPGLIATEQRRSLFPMDLITVLSGAVQHREEQIVSRQKDLDDLRRTVGQLKQRRANLNDPAKTSPAGALPDSAQP